MAEVGGRVTIVTTVPEPVDRRSGRPVAQGVARRQRLVLAGAIGVLALTWMATRRRS